MYKKTSCLVKNRLQMNTPAGYLNREINTGNQYSDNLCWQHRIEMSSDLAS